DEITPKERESYIGIYRLFHNLKQTDDAAIGALLRTGAELTIGNLLTATRSNKVEGRGLDVQIDEDFAGLVAGKRRGSAIDDQIRTAFRTAQAQADIVYDHLEPEALHAAKPQEETSLPELAQALEQAETNAELERSYYAQEQMQWQHSFDARGAAAAAEELVRFDAALTAVNLEGMQRIRTDRSGRTNVWDEMARLAGHVFDEAKQELVETLGEAEDYRQGYINRLDHIGDALTRMMMEETASRLDVAAIGLIRRQLTVTRRLAAQNSFEIPVEVDGQEVSMHVTMETDRTTRGRRISATLSTIDHGDLEMALTESGGQLTGLLTSSYGSEEEQRQFMEGVRRRLTEEIGRTVQGVQVEEQDIGILYRTTNAADKVTAGRGTLDDRSLLRLARAFIVSVG
ncbi:MAG: hypothetical protein IJT34_07150, partial [Butyrivibrio sp.]|nr:hypothetical protein [Butyrivibrio sp.]